MRSDTEWVINRRAGSWEGLKDERGVRERREGIDDSKGGTHVPIEGGVRVGVSGRESLIGRDPPVRL